MTDRKVLENGYQGVAMGASSPSAPTALAPPSGVKPASGLEQSRSSHGAVRRTICDFATSPRDGTPFHILNTMRFNPLMERLEVLVHAEDDPEKRTWRPATFMGEPSVWLRRVPLPYEIPDGQWFPVETATYVVRPRMSWFRLVLHLLFRRKPKQIVANWHWVAAEWVATASVGRNAKRHDPEEGRGPKDEHAVGSEADETPTPSDHPGERA